MMLVGGILMALGTFLDWVPRSSGLSFGSMGLFGIITLVIGIGIGAVGAINAFGLPVELPDKIFGYTPGQLAMIDAFIVFIWTFALVATDFAEAGIHMTWIGAAMAMVGAALIDQPAATT